MEVDELEDVGIFGRLNQEGLVDMAVAIGFDGENVTIQLEVLKKVFHCKYLSLVWGEKPRRWIGRRAS